MIGSLDGRVVVVTGAASGVGKAVAMSAQAAGASLLLTDRDMTGLQRVADAIRGAALYAADLSTGTAPAEIIAQATRHFGRVDGLVNAAGLTTRASLVSGSELQWDSLFAVNARAAFFLMQGVVRDLLARRAPGAIVNILSMNAHCGSPDLAIYAATKGALQTLTRNAASAHMADRIRVNGINLGWTLTESEHHMQANVLGRGQAWAAEVAEGRPLGRLLMPEEVSRMVVYLLSDVSAPLSGAVIDLEQWVAGAP